METTKELSFWEEFLQAFLGTDSSNGEYVAFILFTLIAMSLFKMLRYTRKKNKLALEGEDMEFSRKAWISDNILDFIAAFISAFLVFRFLPEGGHFLTGALNMPALTEKMAYGVILGFAAQFIWHRLLNKVSV